MRILSSVEWVSSLFLIVAATTTSRPNVVILLADNLGYEDVSWFAQTKHRYTEQIDALGRDGLTFTNWNSAAHLCSASRAALLTGLYPARTGVYPGVFHPDAGSGMEQNTLATYLKQLHYSTAAVGKWHLGHLPPYLPTGAAAGFDSWMGVPYHMSGGSVDDHTCIFDAHQDQWLPLYRNTTIFEQPVQTRKLADYYKKEASKFILHNADSPFFLYMAFSHVHQLCASATLPEPSVCQWAATENATFADALQEMDSIVGTILHTLQVAGVENNTLVIFTSDNGPWVAEQSCSGLKGPFQAQWFREHVPVSCTACPHDYHADPTPEQPRRCMTGDSNHVVEGVHCGEDTGLGSVWEANLRMPTLIRWPGKIAPGTSTDKLVSSLDVVPTILSLVEGSDKYNETKFDGVDISSLLLSKGNTEQLNDRVLFFWRDGFLKDLSPLGPPYGRFDVVAVKVGRIKAWFWTKSAHYNNDVEQFHDPPLLFDTIKDPAEAHPLDYSTNETFYKDLVDRIHYLVVQHKADIMDDMYPRTLQRDARNIPCVDPATGCRTVTTTAVEDRQSSAQLEKSTSDVEDQRL